MACLNEKVVYSCPKSYELGDYYRDICRDPNNCDNRAQMFLAAKLCYTLPTIREHPQNEHYKNTQQHSNQYSKNSLKLSELEHWKSMKKLVIPREPKAIPRECLHLIKSFYVPWLEDLRPDLRVL